MVLTTDDVLKVAHLARLAVDETELDAYAKELSSILDLVQQMDTIDTKGVVPMAHPLDMAQRLRPDVVTETNQRELLQSVAPLVEDGLYLVPRVIE
ncbi:Asp-tRNA(Asn)/Glu-tRNA(Gln) amidotransferase subunit GatC [Methylomarinum vadi]|uniref:Asp-tRNA(Asn)/Glu-tRNA(Gln) amidotransferase subunit GatC n=1 Tax=Methylomarinum vadi TaxID=438855 RepID=UPI0004DEE6A5|nr:Asp-tRNA(Asn)/Glu-tRNA(Gln) amidotransferase subunit GatC [Methylomarinum vadi]